MDLFTVITSDSGASKIVVPSNNLLSSTRLSSTDGTASLDSQDGGLKSSPSSGSICHGIDLAADSCHAKKKKEQRDKKQAQTPQCSAEVDSYGTEYPPCDAVRPSQAFDDAVSPVSIAFASSVPDSRLPPLTVYDAMKWRCGRQLGYRTSATRSRVATVSIPDRKDLTFDSNRRRTLTNDPSVLFHRAAIHCFRKGSNVDWISGDILSR